MDIDEVLGFDEHDARDRHAAELVREHRQLLKDLIKVREVNGLSQTSVGEIMGVTPSTVSRIESGQRDMHLSTLRRYAFAVGAVITHEVTAIRDFERRETIPALAAELYPSRQWGAFDRAAVDSVIASRARA